jgi:hypothetical protein
MALLDRLSPYLGVILMLIGIVNPILMYELLGRRAKSPSFRRVHRWLGWVFVAGFFGLFAYMLPRIAGLEKFPVFALLHAVVGLALVPFVMAKVLVARRYTAYASSMPWLGFLILVGTLIVIMLTAGQWFLTGVFQPQAH